MALRAAGGRKRWQAGSIEQAVQSGQEVAQSLAVGAVIDRPSIAAGKHEPIGPEAGKLLGHRRLWKIELSFKLSDRAFLTGQMHQDCKALFMRQRAHGAAKIMDRQHCGPTTVS